MNKRRGASLLSRGSSSKTKTVKTKKITFKSLRKLNITVGVLLALEAVAVLLLSDSDKGSVGITTTFQTADKLASSGAGTTVWVNATHRLFDLNLAYAVAAFLFMGTIAYFLISTRLRKNYEKDLKNNINRLRWIQYGIINSLVLAVVAIVAGVFDITTLMVIMAFSAISNLAILKIEAANASGIKPGLATHGVNLISILAPWVVIAIYIAGAIIYGSNGLPNYAYFIEGSLFLLFALMAVAMNLNARAKGRWADYMYTERNYILLSFVTLSVLAWQVYFGALRFNVG